MKLRNKLIELRGKQSRPEVANKIGITPQMLGAVERGSRNPSLILAKKIADFFHVSVEEIFFDNSGDETYLKSKLPKTG